MNLTKLTSKSSDESLPRDDFDDFDGGSGRPSPSISRLPENASTFPFETGSGGAKRAKSKKEKKK
jgi:hypothetical protein